MTATCNLLLLLDFSSEERLGLYKDKVQMGSKISRIHAVELDGLRITPSRKFFKTLAKCNLH